jgi:uncharacterized protein (TIGR02996 family)
MPPAAASPASSPDTRQSNFVPDTNEKSQDFVDQYLKARQLMGSGDLAAAESALQRALGQYPDSRHLHQLYAELLWDRSRNGEDKALLRQAADHAVHAAELGLQQGFVDPKLTDQVATYLSALGDRKALDEIFGRLTAKDSSAFVRQSYASALARLDDPRAEETLRQAAAAQPDSVDARAAYAEWLLDHGRNEEVLQTIPPTAETGNAYYLSFLRGVALERLNRSEEAAREYARFARYSQSFPAPERYRIPDSRVQGAAGIRFTSKSGGRGDHSGRR